MQKAHIPGFQVRFLFERDGFFIYRRVIPQHLRGLAGQNEFKESLHTRDPSAAREMFNVVHSKYESAILQLRQGIPYNPQLMPELEQLRGVAGSHGMDYLAAAEMIRRNDPRDFLKRFALWDQAGRPEGVHFDALFGAVDDPVKLSDTLSFYEEHVRDGSCQKKPVDQATAGS